MVFSIFKIAEQSPTIQGKLIAYGSGVLIMLQFLINALGILGVTPMTGKTMPFISYGGSSMITMLAIAGLVLRVSLESNPRTVHDVFRARMAVVGEGGPGRPGRGRPVWRRGLRHRGEHGRSGAAPLGALERLLRRGRAGGVPSRPRPPRGGAQAWGAAGDPASRYRSRADAPAGGYERINLDYDPVARLRSRDGYAPRSGGRAGRSRRDR